MRLRSKFDQAKKREQNEWRARRRAGQEKRQEKEERRKNWALSRGRSEPACASIRLKLPLLAWPWLTASVAGARGREEAQLRQGAGAGGADENGGIFSVRSLILRRAKERKKKLPIPPAPGV